MSKDKLLFKNITSKEEFLKLLDQYKDNKIENIFFPNTYVLALKSLSTLNPLSEKRFIELLHYVDNYLNFASQANKNAYHKIPTLLSAAIYLKNYYANIKNYSNAELALLAKYSVIEEPSFFENASLLYPKELLQTIIKKSSDYLFQLEILLLVEKLSQENYTLSDIINYLKNQSASNLLQEAIAYNQKIIEESEENASRRF